MNKGKDNIYTSPDIQVFSIEPETPILTISSNPDGTFDPWENGN